jgi:predicted DNA-binding transcriptional regulator AlpA
MPPTDTTAELLDDQQVAQLLYCSPKHVHRLAAADLMPRPVKLGDLVRWLRSELETWLADGCPPNPRK